MNPSTDISVVVPLFNEQEGLRELYGRLRRVLEGMGHSWEMVFVDDGSTDGSFRELETLYREDPRVRAFRFRRNYGKAAALALGFREARGDVVVTMDADLQDLPEEVPKLVEKLDEGYDLVSGWKRRRRDPISKRLPSKVFNWITSRLTGVPLHDINCGLKAYRREVVRELDVYGHLHRFLPILAFRQGYRVGEVEVAHHPRRYGRSKYGPGRFVHGFLDFMTVLMLTKYLTRPLHLFGGAGLAFSAVGFGINLYLVYLKFRYGHLMGRYPLLWLGILLMVVGVQLFSTGLLGELILNLRREEIFYSVQERLDSTDAA
ncbi:MAG TPA: glycosyltransferase [Candidatus Latescibacteria bacterium]|nr:glycosyltransferase [Candidatus Latescibacterota bacterium]